MKEGRTVVTHKGVLITPSPDFQKVYDAAVDDFEAGNTVSTGCLVGHYIPPQQHRVLREEMWGRQ